MEYEKKKNWSMNPALEMVFFFHTRSYVFNYVNSDVVLEI